MHVGNWNGDVQVDIEAPSLDTATSTTIARQQASLSSKQWHSQAGAHWGMYLCNYATRGYTLPLHMAPIVLLSIAGQATKN